MKNPFISIIINTHNRAKKIAKTLDCIIDFDYPKDKLELLILDDASKDETFAVLNNYSDIFIQKGFKNFKIFRNDTNKHIAYGRWFLQQKICDMTEMSLFVDDDVFVDKSCLKILVNHLVESSKLGIVGPKIVYDRYPNKTAHCANFVNPWTGRYAEIDSEKEIQCDWLNSSCILVEENALKKSEGFYRGFYVSHQEVDFCLRVKKLGFKILYCPEAIARHDILLSKKKPERLYYLYRNKMLLIHRNFPLLNKIIALFLICIFGFPKYIFGSIIVNKGLNTNEIKTIFKAVLHGVLAKEGIKK